jgi:hypothetical protein
MPFGIEVVAIAWVAKSIVLLPAQVALQRRLLDVPVSRLLAPIAAPLAASAIMAVIVGAVFWGLGGAVSDVVVLAVTIPAGALAYAVAVALIAPDLVRTTASAVRLSATPSAAAG